jgi:hypothetical protein
MPNLVGENFDKYVAKQVIDRQLIQGKRTRSNEILSYLNSKTSWIKLTSGVIVVDENRLTSLGIPKDYVGTKLAENFILFNGTSDTKGTLFAGIDRTNSFVNKYAYGMGGNAYGLRPMPGITSCETKFRNRGSVREGTINIKAWNRVQLEIIDLLYLRLGYPVLLEWGHTIIVDKNGAINTNPTNYSVASKFIGATEADRFKTDSDLLRTLADKRRESAGNYDAMYGRVVNFSWTFNKNGSYDITLKLISIGAVVESLRMDVYIKDETNVKDSSTANPNDDSQPKTDKDWIVKYKTSHEFGKLFFDIVSAPKPSGLSTSFIEITDNSDIFKYGDFLYANKLDKYYIRLGALLDFIQKRLIISNVADKEKPSPLLNIDTDRDTNLMYTDPNQVASSDPRVCLVGGIRYKSRSAKSPIDILPELSKYPIFDLAFKVISPDYTVQAGRIMNIYVNMAFVIQKLIELKDDGGKVNLYSLISNILSSINKTLGNVNSLELVIDEDTNTALIIDGTPIPNGGLLIPEIKKNPNIAEEPPTILAYGYYNNGTENQSAGFVRDISFQTKISNELVSMLSIGATANGTVVGEDATAFSKWNYGLEPVMNKSLDYPAKAEETDDLTKQITTIYDDNKLLEESFLKYIEQYKNLNFESLEDFDQYTDLVSRYIEYQQNLQSLINARTSKTENKSPVAAPVSSKGFLPVSLNLTLDGISGVKIYQNLKVDTSFLPQNYPSVLKFLITGVTHRIERNIWTTSLETVSTTITEINNTIPSNTDTNGTNPNIAAPSSANREESRNCGNPVINQIPANPSNIGNVRYSEALNKALQNTFKGGPGEPSMCALYTYSIATSFVNILKGLPPGPQFTRGKGNAKDVGVRTYLKSLGYSVDKWAESISKTEAIKLLNGRKYNVGDILIYWANDGDPAAGCTKYGHIEIYSGKVWNPYNYVKPQNNYVSSVPDNYTANPFVYSNNQKYPQNCWNVYLCKAPIL